MGPITRRYVFIKQTFGYFICTIILGNFLAHDENCSSRDISSSIAFLIASLNCKLPSEFIFKSENKDCLQQTCRYITRIPRGMESHHKTTAASTSFSRHLQWNRYLTVCTASPEAYTPLDVQLGLCGYSSNSSLVLYFCGSDIECPRSDRCESRQTRFECFVHSAISFIFSNTESTSIPLITADFIP